MRPVLPFASGIKTPPTSIETTKASLVFPPCVTCNGCEKKRSLSLDNERDGHIRYRAGCTSRNGSLPKLFDKYHNCFSAKTCTCIWVPCPEALSIRSSPPRLVTRSCIERRPRWP